MNRVLVSGGAGYIGSHACLTLAEAGIEPICFDNFSTGHRAAVQFGPLAEGDLSDPASILSALETWQPDAVMHFAAYSLVGEAEENPAKYWQNNVIGSYNLLEAIRKAGIGKLVFSSTCAVYGEAEIDAPLHEGLPLNPINVYGRTKQAIEAMVADYTAAYDLRSVVLRYFNVAGAAPGGIIGEDHRPETHLIPLVLAAAAGHRDTISIFGTDYPTPDGTCIRDYIHVLDLVDAHIAGLNWLEQGGEGQTLNLGTGHGYSVRAVINAVTDVTGSSFKVIEAPRRAGDPPFLVSGSEKAAELFSWRPQRSSLERMISDAWLWYQTGRYSD